MDLKITLYQTDITWKNKTANLLKLEKTLSKHPEDTDLVILPEMISTGFSMDTTLLAEEMNGSTLCKLQGMAKKYKVALTGSYICKEEEQYFNRLFFIFPTGEIETYDKRHLFTMGGEHNYYTPGQKRLIVTYKGWKIMPLVCYDLRFPIWCRNQEGFHLQLFLANWPTPRAEAWKTLLKARAIENQCYVAGVNRIGTDGNGLSYQGDSMAIDPKGETLWHAHTHKEEFYTLSLSMEELLSFRKKFPVLNDADSFKILK